MMGAERMRNGIAGKQNRWKLVMALLLCAQILLALYYGAQKEGFHEDEFYSYYSTNRTAGLYEPDREWVKSDTFRNEFVVLEGEGFRYGLVSQVQSWDVHPPFFYFLLHTVCSLFPGVFSKWLGISVNLAAFVVNFFLLAWLTFMVTGKNRTLTVLVSAVNGFNATVLSGVLFIRMYEWLTLFVLLCACLHVKAVKDAGRPDGARRFTGFYLPLAAVTYLGFLTQYYYIIFLFFMAAGFSVYLLFVEKKPAELFRYGGSCGVALCLAVLSYPASLSHIFRGYRGTGAVSEFMNAANTGERLRFFGGLLNTFVFDGFLWLWLFLIAAMAGFLLVLKRRGRGGNGGKDGILDILGGVPYFLLLFSVCGYFFTVSKTALLLYETSNRYQLPVYGLLLLLVITALYVLGEWLLCRYGCGKAVKTAGVFLLAAAFLFGDMHGLIKDRVLFLYREEKERLSYARENRETPVVILYNGSTPYHVWWCADELMEYDRVYFANADNPEEITDDTLCSGKRLIVYAADGEEKEERLRMLLKGNPNLSECRLISRKELWSVYELK